MSTNISVLSSSSGMETRFAQDSGTSNRYYCGTAKLNTPEGTDGWTIKRLEISSTGAVIVLSPTGVPTSYNWTDRQSYIY